METIHAVDPTELIEKVAKELSTVEAVEAPKWAAFCKTGAHAERPPARADWWNVRAASILRKVYMKGPIGVAKIKHLYGGKKNRGHKPEQFREGSGNIARKILQQLEKAGYLKQEAKGVHKGRVVTPKGKTLLQKTAEDLSSLKVKETPKKVAEKKAPGKEEKKASVAEHKPVPKKEDSPADKKETAPVKEEKKAPHKAAEKK